MTSRLAIRTLLGLSCFWALACAEEQPGLGACDKERCPERCQDLAGDYCDVLESDCQERIFKAVQCVRGTQGAIPEVRVLTEDDVRTEDEREEEESNLPDAGADAGLDPDPDANATEAWNVALGLLGLQAPVSKTEDAVSYLAGYYDPSEERITLVDRNQPQNSPDAMQTFAHELVHALQDQQVGLSDLRLRGGQLSDVRLAHGCLTEGDAVLYEDLSWTLLEGISVDRDYWDALFARRLKFARDKVVASDSPIEQIWLLRYGVGARYLADAWLEDGNWGVVSLYEAPPTSTVYWMRGYADQKTRAAPLLEPLACERAALPAGYERVGTDTAGAFVFFAFLAHKLVHNGVYPTEESWRRALLWRQDRLEVFADPGGKIALSWRIRLADSETATAIAQELGKLDKPKLAVHVADAELEILASEAKLDDLDWKGTSRKSCPSGASD